MKFLVDLVKNKDYLLYFVLGGIWWSILFMLLQIIKLAVLYADGVLVLK